MKSSVWLASISVVLALVACGDDEVTGPRCGAGTVSSGNQCLPTVTCGEGTEQINEFCVNPDIATCGENTVEADGECRAAPDLTCAPGTQLEGSECVAETGPSCGSGTALEGSECVVSDDLVCGLGTERVGDECLPTVTCGEGTTLVEADCISDRVLGNSLNTVCGAIAMDFCDELQTCCGAQPTELALTYKDVLGNQTTCEFFIAANCFQHIVEEQAAAIALEQAELAVDPLLTLAPYLAVDECTLTLPQYDSVLGSNVPEVIMVTPLQELLDPCVGNIACTSGFTCVEDVEGEPICRNPGSAGVGCDTRDDDDCQVGFYCQYASGDYRCMPYGTLHEANNDCTARLCNPDLGWCDAGICTAYVILGDPCVGDAACGADAYCRDGTCAVYQQVTDSCVDTLDRCDLDLTCEEEYCADTVSACVFFAEEGT